MSSPRMERPRHPHKVVEDAVQEAEHAGWRVLMSKRGHAWGTLLCPEGSRDGVSTISVVDTPRRGESRSRHSPLGGQLSAREVRR